MKRASITEAKNNLSALIDSLKGGARVLIVDRGRPVARLEPVIGDDGGDDGRLSRLTREELVRPRRFPPTQKLFSTQPPPPKNVHRQLTLSLRSAGKAGDILGLIGDRAAARDRNDDTALTSPRDAGRRYAGVVGVRSGMRIGTCPARTCGRAECHRHNAGI